MLVKPTVLELLEKVDNRFELVTMTAKRARQLASGSIPLTKKDEPSPVSLAADEIVEGKITKLEEE
jgi:DNA-directed RNA polymerase subunit omega